MVIHADHDLSDDFRRIEVHYRAPVASHTFLALVGVRSLYRSARQATSRRLFVCSIERSYHTREPKGQRTDSARFVDERSTADQPRPRVGHNGPARTRL
jgi:hypothetical protein